MLILIRYSALERMRQGLKWKCVFREAINIIVLYSQTWAVAYVASYLLFPSQKGKRQLNSSPVFPPYKSESPQFFSWAFHKNTINMMTVWLQKRPPLLYLFHGLLTSEIQGLTFFFFLLQASGNWNKNKTIFSAQIPVTENTMSDIFHGHLFFF